MPVSRDNGFGGPAEDPKRQKNCACRTPRLAPFAAAAHGLASLEADRQADNPNRALRRSLWTSTDCTNRAALARGSAFPKPLFRPAQELVAGVGVKLPPSKRNRGLACALRRTMSASEQGLDESYATLDKLLATLADGRLPARRPT
jgi:hypothetical protein